MSNIPPPFNDEFDPRAPSWFKIVAQEMETDGFYQSHTREENRAEFLRRYGVLKNNAQQS